MIGNHVRGHGACALLPSGGPKRTGTCARTQRPEPPREPRSFQTFPRGCVFKKKNPRAKESRFNCRHKRPPMSLCAMAFADGAGQYGTDRERAESSTRKLILAGAPPPSAPPLRSLARFGIQQSLEPQWHGKVSVGPLRTSCIQEPGLAVVATAPPTAGSVPVLCLVGWWLAWILSYLNSPLCYLNG